MNWLNAIPEADRAEIRKNLFASPEFFEAVRCAVFSLPYLPEGEESWFARNFKFGIDAAFARHGFRQPHSATSVSHNVMAENTERDRHAARMLALSTLIARAKTAEVALGTFSGLHKERNELALAIAAVEREFKP